MDRTQSEIQRQSQIAGVQDHLRKASYIAAIQSTAEWIWIGRPSDLPMPKLNTGDGILFDVNAFRVFR